MKYQHAVSLSEVAGLSLCHFEGGQKTKGSEFNQANSFGFKFLDPHMPLELGRGDTYPKTFIWAAGYDYSNIHRQIIAKLRRNHSVNSIELIFD